MRESHRLQAVQTPIVPVIAGLIRENPGTISLGQGVVNYAPPPRALEAIAAFGDNSSDHKYQAAAGLPALIDAVAQKLAAENGFPVGAAHGNRLMATAGGNQAFFNVALAILDPDDEVILPTPYYFNHEMAIAMANARAVPAPTDRNYRLDLDALRAAITPRTRAIVTVSPNNPSGVVYPESDLRAVNELCANRGLYHINDEAYEYFTYDDARHFSPASIPGAAAHTISLYSMSKAYGFASWRIGWAAYPAALEAAMTKIQDTILICPPAISQMAAIGALTAGRPWVQSHVRTLAQTRTKVRDALMTLAQDGLAEIPPAQGALYFLLRPKTSLTPLDYVTQLIRDHRVAAIPGDAFGLTRGCALRVAYGALDSSTAEEGVGRLVAGVRALAR